MNRVAATIDITRLTAKVARAHRAFPGLLRMRQQIGLVLLFLALSACVSQGGDASISTPSSAPASSAITEVLEAITPDLPTSTAIPISTPSPSPAHTSPATTEVSQATTSDSPIPTAGPDLPPPLPGWAWNQSRYTGYRIAYPQTWSQKTEWGSYSQPGSATGGLGRIQERVNFQSPETNSEVIVDVWDVTSLPAFDLLDWVNTNPERMLFDHSTEPIAYNATILGQPAVFQYHPAEWGTGDMATLLFAAEGHCFRIFFSSAVLPIVEAEPSIYLYMLESFSLPGRPADGVSIPTGWERGMGLITRLDPPPPALVDLPPDEQLPYRQGLTGRVEDWDDTPYEIRFTLLTDEGQRYAIYGESFRVHFCGWPIDYNYHVSVPRPQDGNRVRVAGQFMTSGDVLAQYIAIEISGEWQTWFHKSLFDVARDEFDPVLLANYLNEEAVDLWLQGPLEQTLVFLVDERGNSIGTERWPQHLEQDALAHGVLRANGDLRVELQDLYVQEGECTVSSDRKHCHSWRQLYPAVSATTTITATVLASDPEGGVIVLQQPVEGFVTITLAPDGQLLTKDGESAAWEDVTTGTPLRASGEAEAAGTLLAQQIHLTTPQD